MLLRIVKCGLILFLLLAGCTYEVPKPEEEGLLRLEEEQAEQVLRQIDPTSQGLESWQDLAPALHRSLEYVQTKPQGAAALESQGLTVSWGALAQSLEILLDILPRLDSEPELLLEHFNWYVLQPEPLFTGYFQYELPASLLPCSEYNVPIFAAPEDLQTTDLGQFHPRWQGQRLVYRIQDGEIEPYPDRESIEPEDALEDQARVLAWAKDAVDVFFLQIQGSGQLRLPEGRVQNIGYAAKNDRPYVSLGRVLAREGHLEPHNLSMDSIQDYLHENPELMPEILFTNPSYVFFRFTEGGPYGAMGRELTPMVSLATDRNVLALGSILAYAVDLPQYDSQGPEQAVGLGLAQDVGGAIQGHHLDLFFGAGDEARYRAARMKYQGQVYLLLARAK